MPEEVKQGRRKGGERRKEERGKDRQTDRQAYIFHTDRDRKESGDAPGTEDEGRRQRKNNRDVPGL